MKMKIDNAMSCLVDYDMSNGLNLFVILRIEWKRSTQMIICWSYLKLSFIFQVHATVGPLILKFGL